MQSVVNHLGYSVALKAINQQLGDDGGNDETNKEALIGSCFLRIVS